MVLNQLSEWKNPSQYNSVLGSKQIDQQWVISWILRGFPPTSSYDLCPYLISSRTALIHT